jgi:hypothetical protein
MTPYLESVKTFLGKEAGPFRLVGTGPTASSS